MKEPITIVRGNDFYLNVIVSRTLEDGSIVPYDLSNAYNIALKLVTSSGRYAEFPCTAKGNIITAKILSYKLGLTTYGIEITFINDKLAKRSFECGLLKIVNCECQTNETTTSDNKYYDINLEVVTDAESIQIGKVTPVHVDDKLDIESEFPVQNKVITEKINELQDNIDNINVDEDIQNALSDFTNDDVEFNNSVTVHGSLNAESGIITDEIELGGEPIENIFVKKTDDYVTTNSMAEFVDNSLTKYYDKDEVNDLLDDKADITSLPDMSLYVAKTQLDDTLTSYVKSTELDETLASYVTNSQLDTRLEKYTTNKELETTLDNYATKKYVDDSILRIDLSEYVTNDELEEYSYDKATTYSLIQEAVNNIDTSKISLDNYYTIDDIDRQSYTTAYALTYLNNRIDNNKLPEDVVRTGYLTENYYDKPQVDDKIASGGSVFEEYIYYSPDDFNERFSTKKLYRQVDVSQKNNSSHFNDYLNKVRDLWDKEYSGSRYVNPFYESRYDMIFVPYAASNEIDILQRSDIRPADYENGLTIKYYDNDTSNYPPMEFIRNQIDGGCPDLYLTEDTSYGKQGDLRINLTVLDGNMYYDGGRYKLWDKNDGWNVTDETNEYSMAYERFNNLMQYSWMAMVDWWTDIPNTDGGWPAGTNRIRHHNDWRLNKDLENYKDLLVFVQFAATTYDNYYINDNYSSNGLGILLTTNNFGNHISMPNIAQDMSRNNFWFSPSDGSSYPTEAEWEQIAKDQGYNSFEELRNNWGRDWIFYVREA